MTIIVIDAGHGPDTAGKRSPDGLLREFHFNMAVAQLVKDTLLPEGVDVVFSHEKGRDVPLKERTALANKLKADAFISIHANAVGNEWNTAQGIETYIYPSAGRNTQSLRRHLHSSLLSASSRNDRGMKKADFAVLRDTLMPAVLLECGFMTNQEEVALLLNNEYRVQCARAIAFGITSWLYQMKTGRN